MQLPPLAPLRASPIRIGMGFFFSALFVSLQPAQTSPLLIYSLPGYIFRFSGPVE
jgi:hypothetical protein